MSLLLEPKISPAGPVRYSRGATIIVPAADEDDDLLREPSSIFAKLDAIAEGRHLPRPVPTRLVFVTESDEPLLPGVTPAPRHATRLSFLARLRHALTWKG
ncbi:hypothetical protein MTE01_28610 [Microbacterium testaceum]|uniref:Uncharacterized protein n=1 Tax=Microbacterium testaceum TaxID=2033 RepID=A0A4Y3QNB1_MICTE|nr:hypothetical protein [Microbacterium testaceum]GEB46916.1 hypothetical protein MTE01_28610 [Microbacterium testaceum]